MASNERLTDTRPAPESDHERIVQNETALEVSTGAALPLNPSWQDIINVLNNSLATELVCMLRYKRHRFIADGLAIRNVGEKFLGYANEGSAHAARLARRIVELGGEPDYSMDSLTGRSYVAYDDASGLEAMISANETVERVVVQSYGQIIRLIGDRDPVTRLLLQDILTEHSLTSAELEIGRDQRRQSLASEEVSAHNRPFAQSKHR